MFNFEELSTGDFNLLMTPFGSYNHEEKKWREGWISVEYLNHNFRAYNTAEEMKNATKSEGLKLYFDWLKEKGILN